MEPLRVYYPLGGRVLLLHWWTDDDRGHVVLAPSERALLATAKRVFDANPEAGIRFYADVEIVAPSKSICEQIARRERERTIGSFKYEMTGRMFEAAEAGHALPWPFAMCLAYDRYPSRSATRLTMDPEVIEHDKSTHYACRNCTNQIALAMSPEEFYERYAPGWCAHDPGYQPPPPDPRRAPSRGRVANDGEELYAAVADFGHHAEGVVLTDAEAELDPARILFFYSLIVKRDCAPLQAMLDNALAATKAARAQKSSRWKEERERETRERIERDVAFFATRQPA